jgi:hypothetical protein
MTHSDAERLDAAPASGGLPSAGTDEGDDLEQAATIGETDDPQGGGIQGRGSRS